MKEKILHRINRLEEELRQGVRVPLVAIKDASGIHWNGVQYDDDESFSQAAKMILGDVWEKPLVIIQLRGDFGGK